MGHVRPRVGHVSYWCPNRIGVPLKSESRTGLDKLQQKFCPETIKIMTCETTHVDFLDKNTHIIIQA